MLQRKSQFGLLGLEDDDGIPRIEVVSDRMESSSVDGGVTEPYIILHG
jgi:hypothetical protein